MSVNVCGRCEFEYVCWGRALSVPDVGPRGESKQQLWTLGGPRA